MIALSALVTATDADIPAIVELMNRAYRGSNTSSWTTESGYITGDRTTQDLLRAELAAKPDGSFLTWRDEQRVLQACVWLEPIAEGTWYLGSLAVNPQRQKGGLGRALLKSAELWLRERGAKRVRMTVVNVRESLIAWYMRRGYRRTGETTPFPYGDDRFGIPQRDDLCFVVLEKDLGETLKGSHEYLASICFPVLALLLLSFSSTVKAQILVSQEWRSSTELSIGTHAHQAPSFWPNHHTIPRPMVGCEVSRSPSV